MKKTKLTLLKTGCALLVVVATSLTLPAQVLSTLASFNGFDGGDPYYGPLVQGLDGNFYGTTSSGGANCVPYGCGTVFKATPDGAITTLYSFCAEDYCPDGAYPYAGLLLASDGNFYGTTTEGGTDIHGGTVFKITPAGKLTTLYGFCAQTNCADGNYPTAPLIQGGDGNFYGTTFSGGIGDAQYCQGGCGTVFKITPKGVATILHSFVGYNLEGSGPTACLVQGPDGSFYGTTTNGGAYDACTLGCGTVFKITPKGVMKTLHSFAGSPNDAAQPFGGLTLGSNGILYGTASAGGTADNGTVFKITAAGTLTTVYNFCTQPNCVDGGQPEAGVVLATDGNLYGTAARGGTYVIGSIFKITPSDVFTTLYSFCSQGFPSCPDGSFLYAGLIQATSGKFYGSTFEGGDSTCGSGYGCGTVFSFDMGLGPFVSFVRDSAKVGQAFDILGQGLSGTTGVSLNDVACDFAIKSDKLIVASVPEDAATGYVDVITPNGTLKSNEPLHVIP